MIAEYKVLRKHLKRNKGVRKKTGQVRVGLAYEGFSTVTYKIAKRKYQYFSISYIAATEIRCRRPAVNSNSLMMNRNTPSVQNFYIDTAYR